MKRMLVLGSSGQIGSALCNYLKELKYDVREFDIVKNPTHDLREKSSYLDWEIGICDFVFFLAFDVGGSTYLKTYQHTFQFMDNNVRLMQVTFDALQRYKKPFIFASSQMSNMSFSSYGMLKNLGELYTKSLNGIVIKLWNVYGVEHDPSKTHVITDFVKMALEKKQITMRTDGEEERQLLYARDCSEALLTISEKYNEIPRDKELHIAPFKWVKILDIAKNIAILCDNIPIVVGKDVDSVQRGQKNEPDPYILSMWKPTTTIEDGIKNIVEYYKNASK